ncbi:hypothetical protein [Micromonospora sp. NPDC051006]|uniref:hypothetical protein n=1 Tax=Micromonospora sp. NPDC051006 TaxID=3364283 RepID=UPI0037AAADE0
MPERPVARDDAAIEHQPPPGLSLEPRDSASDASDVDRADGAEEHKSHDPYQPL